tara:strand:+ start:610 stop:1380 length:771 start_codon:yes stop_codon:yes gene_type:complete
MDDLTRLIISSARLKNIHNNKLELTAKESHYLNKVMRLKNSQEVFIVDGLGSIWKGKKKENNFIQLVNFSNPDFFCNRKLPLIGLAIAIPKKGFEDILKMSTEIGIDLIQPISTHNQVKNLCKISPKKEERWDHIINESVEQCERLWKPKILKNLNISDWLASNREKDFISISVTRNDYCPKIENWLDELKIFDNKEIVIWNVIGPEGGWSLIEMQLFKKYQIDRVRLTENILRTSTAAIYASSILNKWRNNKLTL